jgi:hypothetical protein
MDNKAEILALLKTLLGISAADTSRDLELDSLIDGAIAVCEIYLDDIIDRRSVTETWTSGKFPQLLRYRDASDLTEATLDGEDVLSSWSIVAGDAYAKLKPNSGAFEIDDEVFSVSYSAGFASCPYPLKLVIRDVASHLEARSGAPEMARIKRENIVGVGSVEYADQGSGTDAVGVIPPQCVQILNMYRRPTF